MSVICVSSFLSLSQFCVGEGKTGHEPRLVFSCCVMNALIILSNYIYHADLCSLGYHNCHQQANCTQSGESVLCSCVDGYMGDGITCTQISLCDNISCVENATCEIVNEVNTSIAHCTCNIGYTGNGQSCVLIGECEETCSTSDDPNIRCIVSTGDGRIDCGSENVQQLQETVR